MLKQGKDVVCRLLCSWCRKRQKDFGKTPFRFGRPKEFLERGSAELINNNTLEKGIEARVTSPAADVTIKYHTRKAVVSGDQFLSTAKVKNIVV